jgi:hypothetical protein
MPSGCWLCSARSLPPRNICSPSPTRWPTPPTGLLGFEAALKRDYPVMFASLYFFGLLGLIMQLISDMMYVVIDPRIDFESREV